MANNDDGIFGSVSISRQFDRDSPDRDIAYSPKAIQKRGISQNTEAHDGGYLLKSNPKDYAYNHVEGEYMMTLLLFIVVMMVLFVLLPIKRLREAVMAQFHKGSQIIWKADPVAIYQSRIEEAMEVLSSEKNTLVEARGLLSRIERENQAYQENVTRLDARIAKLMAENQEAEAQSLAEKLVREKRKLSDSQRLLSQQKENYERQTQRFKDAWDKIETEKGKASEYKVRLDLSKIEARMNELHSTSYINQSLGSLGEIQQEIEHQIDANQATSFVDADLGLAQEDNESEEQIKSEASGLLAQYRQPLIAEH